KGASDVVAAVTPEGPSAHRGLLLLQFEKVIRMKKEKVVLFKTPIMKSLISHFTPHDDGHAGLHTRSPGAGSGGHYSAGSH
ncbi:hypothetical protein K4H00_26025, partial [Mycobacterium tuberculosis]|nr:hypothetical protein [Mycobacterium tuberculosis]